jgi:hypothetical protein
VGELVSLVTSGQGWEWLAAFRAESPKRCAIGLRHVAQSLQATLRASAGDAFDLKPSKVAWILWGIRGSNYVNPSDLATRIWLDPTRGFLAWGEGGGDRTALKGEHRALPSSYVQLTSEGLPRSFDLPGESLAGGRAGRVFKGAGRNHAPWRGHLWIFRRSAGTTQSKRLYRTWVKGRASKVAGFGGLKRRAITKQLRTRTIQRRDVRPLYNLERVTHQRDRAWWSAPVVAADPISMLRDWIVADIAAGRT